MKLFLVDFDTLITNLAPKMLSRLFFRFSEVFEIFKSKGDKNDVFGHFQRPVKSLTIVFQHPGGCQIKVLFSYPFQRIFDCYDPIFLH